MNNGIDRQFSFLPGLSVYRPFTMFAMVDGVIWNGVDWASKSKAEIKLREV